MLATVAFAEGKSVWFPGEWQLAGADGSLTGVKTLVPNAAEADLMVVGVAEGLALVEKGAAYRTERADSGDRTRPVDTVLFEGRSEEHTSELQSLMRISYAVFCLKKKQQKHRKILHRCTR